MQSLRYLNTLLLVIAVLLALQLWTAWAGGSSPAQTAIAASPTPTAGFAGAGQQRKQIVDELKRLNQEMERLTRLFEQGDARVRIDSGSK